MQSESQTVPNSMDTYRRLLRYVRPYRMQFGFATLGMVGYGITDTAFAALMKPMLDGGFVEQDPRSIVLVPLFIILIAGSFLPNTSKEGVLTRTASSVICMVCKLFMERKIAS